MLRIQYLIYVYIVLCVCMAIYNIFYTLYNRTMERKISTKNSKFFKKIKKQLILTKCGTLPNAKHGKYLYKKLKRVRNLIIFEQILDEYEEKITEKYIENIRYTFYKLTTYYAKVNTIKKAYFSYIIGKYKIIDVDGKTTIINLLFEFLNEEAMYCRDNSLKAIIRQGNIDNIIKALHIVARSNYYYSIEIIYDNLLEFRENKYELSKKIYERFSEFNENIQIAIIQFITKYNLNYASEFYILLQNELISNKIKIEIIKFFKENPLEQVEPILINNIKLTGILNRELVIESAKALSNYNSIIVKEELKELLKRKDWEIRMVASESLTKLGASYYDLVDIYNGEDNIARAILKYKVQSYKYIKMNKKAEVS